MQSRTNPVNYSHKCAKCLLIAPNECCNGLAFYFYLWKCLKGWFIPDSGHGERIQCHFLMPNLFKCFCLKAKLMIFTSTKASTTTQDMHFCICKCIRPLKTRFLVHIYHWTNIIERFFMLYMLIRKHKTFVPSTLPCSYKTHPCGVPPLRGRESHNFQIAVFLLFLYSEVPFVWLEMAKR